MSGYLLEQPLVIQGSGEEAAGTFGNAQPLQFLPSARNYASNEKCRRFFQEEIYPLLGWTRQDRQGLEAEWNQIREMNAMKHGDGQAYTGRSDAYMPLYKRERRKLINTYSKGLFPTDEYFDVVDRGTGDPELAKPVKTYMQWEMETNARIRLFMKPSLGSLVDFGTAPLKFWYKKQIRSEGRLTPRTPLEKMLARSVFGGPQGMGGGPQGPQGSGGTYEFKNYCREGLAVSPRNLLYWYIYPSTAETLDDATMVFEDVDVPIAFVEWMKLMKRWHDVDGIVEAQGAEDIPEHVMNRLLLLSQRGEGMQLPGSGTGGKVGQFVTTTEIWTYMQLPPEAYLGHEDNRLPVPVVITAIGSQAVEIRRNPFFHQRSPYAVARVDWEAGMYYGNAEGRVIKPLQLLTNDFMNQTLDNGSYGLNPLSLMDINKMAPGSPGPIFPGASWYTLGNPREAIVFDRPPIEQVQTGMGMVNMLMGAARDMGGAPPDFGTKGAATDTATGMSIAQRNTVTPIADVVQDIEAEQILPILQNGWKNAVQFREEEVMVSVAGEQIVVHPDMLAIDAQFRCLAASQAANQQVRTQQMMSLVQAITPLVPMIAQQGYIVDFVSLFKRVWTDGFGLRGFSEFIRKGAAVPGMGPPRPDQMGGVQAEQQDNLRSALQQTSEGAGNPDADPVPGETEDFTAIRSEADQLAGMMGGGLR